MHISTKVVVIKEVALSELLIPERAEVKNILGLERFILFNNAAKETLDHYQVDIAKTTNPIDLVIRTIRNDKEAKYERFYEVAFTILGKSKDDKPSQMDFTFEIFKVAGEVEACELMSYYLSEYKTE